MRGGYPAKKVRETVLTGCVTRALIGQSEVTITKRRLTLICNSLATKKRFTPVALVAFNAHPVKHYKMTITRTLISKRRYYSSLKYYNLYNS